MRVSALKTNLAFRARRMLWGLLVGGLIGSQAGASPLVAQPTVPTLASTPIPVGPQGARRADFGQTGASKEARHLAHWVVDSGDNLGMPFVIVDKRDARVFVFGAKGKLSGASPALLGLAIGDHSVPGIGEKKLSDIRPEERTTPAGRFVANLDNNLKGQEMLWVDYETAVSLHPVVPGHPRERRAQRLASSSPAERRISFGCINVPATFYKQVVSPAFTGTNGIVYVLPEIRSLRDVFGSFGMGGVEPYQEEVR